MTAVPVYPHAVGSGRFVTKSIVSLSQGLFGIGMGHLLAILIMPQGLRPLARLAACDLSPYPSLPIRPKVARSQFVGL